MIDPAQNASKSDSLLIAVVLPLSMLLAFNVSPAFVLTYPSLYSLKALRSGEKQRALAGAIGLALCGAMLISMAGYRIGKDMAHRDNAMSCPARTGISPQ
jgi:hypothetical protein